MALTLYYIEDKMKTIPVTARALTARISRKLVKSSQKLIKIAPAYFDAYGKYAIVDTRSGSIINKNIDLESIGIELKCLKPYERLDKTQYTA